MTAPKVAIVGLALVLVATIAWVVTRRPEVVVVQATTTSVVRVPAGPAEASADDPWAQQRGDLAFVLGMEAGLARAKAEGRRAFVFYTQHG